MSDLWKEMRAEQDHRIHVEFAHFSNFNHFRLFMEYAVMNADSLGLNEVELQMLIKFITGEFEHIEEENKQE